MSWFTISLLSSFLIWFYFIYKQDKIQKEPLWALFLIIVIGGTLSVLVAGFFNSIAATLLHVGEIFKGQMPDKTNSMLFMIFVGLNEEFFKFLFTILLIRRLKAFDEPVDGIIYAMSLALGFASLENIGYMSRYGANIIFIRSVSAVPLHVGLAAIWGIGIAKARFLNLKKSYLSNSILYILFAAIIHTFYNSTGFFIDPGYSILVSIALAMFLIWISKKLLFKFLLKSPNLPDGFCTKCGKLNNIQAINCIRCKYPLR